MALGKVTLAARQRQMLEFMDNSKNYRFIGLGKRTPWPVEEEPPEPDETMTDLEEIIGLQRVDYYKYAKLIKNPTTLQKRTGVYYKGLYYSVTQDSEVAINDGYTDVIIGITFDRDTIAAIPIDVSFRQVGLFDTVNATSSEIQYGISADAWNNKSTADKGMLVAVENRAPVTRQDDQTEQVIMLVSF